MAKTHKAPAGHSIKLYLQAVEELARARLPLLELGLKAPARAVPRQEAVCDTAAWGITAGEAPGITGIQNGKKVSPYMISSGTGGRKTSPR
jgi:hypothetical protein